MCGEARTLRAAVYGFTVNVSAVAADVFEQRGAQFGGIGTGEIGMDDGLFLPFEECAFAAVGVVDEAASPANRFRVRG